MFYCDRGGSFAYYNIRDLDLLPSKKYQVKSRDVRREVKDSSFGAWRGRGHLISENVLAPRVSAGEKDVKKSQHSYMQTNKDEEIELLASD